jgi:hypothetical protein
MLVELSNVIDANTGDTVHLAGRLFVTPCTDRRGATTVEAIRHAAAFTLAAGRAIAFSDIAGGSDTTGNAYGTGEGYVVVGDQFLTYDYRVTGVPDRFIGDRLTGAPAEAPDSADTRPVEANYCRKHDIFDCPYVAQH